MKIEPLTAIELGRLRSAGLINPPKLAPMAPLEQSVKPRKPYTFKPETLARMRARKTPWEELRRRKYEQQRLKQQRNMAAGLTNDGKPRKNPVTKNVNAINALKAGLVPYLQYDDTTYKAGLFMAAKRMGVRLRFADGKCTLDNGGQSAHTHV